VKSKMKGISKWKGIEELFMEEWKAGIFFVWI
jgi:hypothetical protein